MKKMFLIATLLFSIASIAQEINVIPQPVEVKLGKGSFILSNKTKIYCDKSSEAQFEADYLKQYIKNYYKIDIEINEVSKKADTLNSIFIVKKQGTGDRIIIPKGLSDYQLAIKANNIFITGSKEGTFYGIQTLIQLLPIPYSKPLTNNIEIPQLTITDYARFPYRGMHLDVCRHFFPVSFVKKYIDYLAYHKLNIFHWHLTEDQGWRIEIKKYPELTNIGSNRNGTIIGRYPGTGNDNIAYGGFYTQEQIKEVVQYAKERFIEVIPEIEMPGHGSAAIAAYPWLSCFPDKPTDIPMNMISQKSIEEQKNGRIKFVQETWGIFDDIFCAGKDATFLFLQNVIDEVIPLFPSKYFHIGGDEAPKTHWKQCILCQNKIKELDLKDEHELQSWFVQRIEKYLNSQGKTLIGWDEILEGGLAPNAVVMSWRGEAGGIEAAKQKHNVIMTPGNPLYFDHTQSENEDSVTIGGFNPIEKVYAYEPASKELTEEESKYILGAQANVWTEYMSNEKKVEYMIFPRMAALSEVLWSPKEKKDWRNFEKRLPEQMKRYEMWGANYSKAFYDLKAKTVPAENASGVLWQLTYRNSDDKIIIARDKYYSKTDIYNQPIKVDPVGKYYAAIQNKEGLIISNWIDQQFHINKATGKKITLKEEATKNYPGDGAFTLVNGVINEKGFSRTKEFLGFSGTDCEALIDLGAIQEINSIVVHTFSRITSWIWKPQSTEAFGSTDGKTWNSLKMTDDFVQSTSGNGKGTMTLVFKQKPVQFVKVVVKNWGTIPDGNAGAGKKAWLFVDEIEVN